MAYQLSDASKAKFLENLKAAATIALDEVTNAIYEDMEFGSALPEGDLGNEDAREALLEHAGEMLSQLETMLRAAVKNWSPKQMSYGEINITEEIRQRRAKIRELENEIKFLARLRDRTLPAIKQRALVAISDAGGEGPYNQARAEARALQEELWRIGANDLNIQIFPEHWKIL